MVTLTNFKYAKIQRVPAVPHFIWEMYSFLKWLKLRFLGPTLRVSSSVDLGTINLHF